MRDGCYAPAAMRATSFQDVAGAGEDELRQLLADGDPPERVWAAWALAQRVAQPGIEAAARLRHEPDAGVRRHLVTVAAGHGEDDVLAALARHDPDPGVRSTAMILVARLVEAGRLPPALVLEGLRDPSSDVRAAVIHAMADPRLAAPLLDDPSATVRWAALDRLMDADALELIATALETCADAERAERLVRLQRRFALAALAPALATSSIATRRVLLDQLRPSRPTWAEVAPIVGDDQVALAGDALHCLGRFSDDVPLLLFLAAVGDNTWYVGSTAGEVAARLLTASADHVPPSVVRSAVAACDAWLAEDDALRANANAWDDYSEASRLSVDRERTDVLTLRAALLARAAC